MCVCVGLGLQHTCGVNEVRDCCSFVYEHNVQKSFLLSVPCDAADWIVKLLHLFTLKVLPSDHCVDKVETHSTHSTERTLALSFFMTDSLMERER